MRGDAGRALELGAVRGVHCTFVMIWLRRRSMVALPSLRMGRAWCLRRRTGRSRSGTWRPADVWRRWKGTRLKYGARCPLFVLLSDDVSSS